MAMSTPEHAAAGVDTSKIWTTLLTNRGYLAGLLVLDHTIKKHGSKYQLVVMLSGDAATDPEMHATLEAAGIPLRIVDKIEPAPQNGKVNRGTWEKLAPWGFTEYERVTLLDSDQIALHNFDELMTVDMPKGWIAASHACTCNPRKLAHYPKDWVPENCGFTAANKTDGQPQVLTSDSPANHRLLNSGTVVLSPSKEDYDTLIHTMNTHPAVPNMIFFDQDLLPIVYDNKWLPLPYIYNGLKTLRGCHSDLWKDGDVKILHYILAKPWKSRTIDQDIVGIQHQLWWDEYNQLESNWKAAKNATRNNLWKNIVEPQVAPKESPFKALASGLPWKLNPLASRQLPSTLQIPASYRTSESVLLAVLLALLFGFFIGRRSRASAAIKGVFRLAP